jgi:hypothetical protein
LKEQPPAGLGEPFPHQHLHRAGEAPDQPAAGPRQAQRGLQTHLHQGQYRFCDPRDETG